MHWLTLPSPKAVQPPAFLDLAGARSWLATQPQAQPLLMQRALSTQIDAIDAGQLAPAQAVELLDFLHHSVVPTQASLEVRYARKALPMPADEERIFGAAQELWSQLGIAYLRRAPHLAPAEKCPLLLRAANAFRMAEFCHFLAGRECPPLLDQLLFAVLIHGESSGILRQPVADTDLPHLGEANIAGLLAWAFLLRLLDPYRLTSAQLTVANRALSRWRELCSFHAVADPSPKVQGIALAAQFDVELPEGTPAWLNIRSVSRKIQARLDALRRGETPEALKLGRELSASACIRLLLDIEQRLQLQPATASLESGELLLVFGAEHAFSVFTDEYLNPSSGMDVTSGSLSNQRMAVFGFDQVSRLPTAVCKLDIPGETWTLAAGRASRAGWAGARRLAPCLVANTLAGQPRLGVLRALLCDGEATLKGRIDWYGGTVEAYRLQQQGLREQKLPRVAVFLLREATQMSLILPSNAPIRPGVGLALEGHLIQHLVPTEVIERGIDFVRYACRPG